MNNTKGFLKTLLIVITTILLTLVVLVVSIVGYIWFKNPYGIKDILFPTSQGPTATTTSSDNITATQLLESATKPNGNVKIQISDEQKEALNKIGIEPQNLPTEISKTMMDCFVEKLGQERAGQILAGATPNAIDLFKARSCVQ